MLMFRTQNRQMSIWEAVLPDELRLLPRELALVDGLLDDPSFWDPFRPHFHETFGRPSIPIETYLRMMFLKSRYGLGYERLCVEVADSISWQIFCRMPLAGDVPSPSTLGKITKRVGDGVIQAVNDALLARAAAAGLVDLSKVRVDSTVVEANVSYPTDSGLLTKAVRRIGLLVVAIWACGAALRTPFRNRTRSAVRRCWAIGHSLKRRSEESRETVWRLNLELAQIAEKAVGDADAVLRNARRFLHEKRNDRDGRLRRKLDDLAVLLERTRRIIDQTRERMAGQKPDGASRIVSLHDGDARPISKGRLDKKVEFGYKCQVVDNRDGLVLDYSVHQGNPSDKGLLLPAVRRIKARFGRVPARVAADRGYYSEQVETDLAAEGVAKVAIPKIGDKNDERREHEHQRWFRRLVIWRTGAEARISRLKNNYAMARTLFDGTDGTTRWCGWVVFAHNTVTLTRLIEPDSALRIRRSRRNRQAPPEPAATGPPPPADLALTA